MDATTKQDNPNLEECRENTTGSSAVKYNIKNSKKYWENFAGEKNQDSPSYWKRKKHVWEPATVYKKLEKERKGRKLSVTDRERDIEIQIQDQYNGLEDYKEKITSGRGSRERTADCVRRIKKTLDIWETTKNWNR